MVLGFTERELEEVWETFDKNGDISLSKGEVADIFSMKYDKELEESKYIDVYDDDSEIEGLKNRNDGPKLSRKQTVELVKTYREKL